MYYKRKSQKYIIRIKTIITGTEVRIAEFINLFMDLNVKNHKNICILILANVSNSQLLIPVIT